MVCQSGRIEVHPSRRAEPKEWEFVLAHCVLHLGFGHFVGRFEGDLNWQAACDVVVDKFLRDLKIGDCPYPEMPSLGGNEASLYRTFRESGLPDGVRGGGTGAGQVDMIYDGDCTDRRNRKVDFRNVFAIGLRNALANSVEKAAGYGADAKRPVTAGQRAQRWFLSNYPLLGAMASAFTIVEDIQVCQRLNIAVAAVYPGAREIYINPAVGMNDAEYRFVMAHEILHVGLRHAERIGGRDPYLWNVACDFVINGWLMEMGVGMMPEFGALHDPELKGLQAEAVYDRIVQDLRRYRKLATVRGIGLCDILGPSDGAVGPGEDLEDFYRRALSQGLELHRQMGRGLLPAGLVQEIEALSAPPIPWDVRLAQWLDGYFVPLETRRTYSRASRRQSATPDIPRPRIFTEPVDERARTFGVVLDTSGSMDRELLGKGLGSIVSYALSREVPKVRLVFCDATTYDEGYVSPEEIAGRVRVRGRGGTVLQPGIDFLEAAEDFPPDGPILIITDGICDRFRSHRNHAILLPAGGSVPFVPRCPVFEIEK